MLPPSTTGLLYQQRRGRPLTRGDVADKIFSSTRGDHSSFFDLSERHEEFCTMFNANNPYVFPNLQPAPQAGGAGNPNLFAPPAQQQQPQQHQQQQPQQQPGGCCFRRPAPLVGTSEDQGISSLPATQRSAPAGPSTTVPAGLLHGVRAARSGEHHVDVVGVAAGGCPRPVLAVFMHCRHCLHVLPPCGFT